MKNLLFLLMFISLFISCQDDTVNEISENQHTSSIISGVDISDYPKVSSYNPTFYDENNNEIGFINSLIQNGVNTIRLRLWVNPVDESSSLDEVKEFSNELKSLGFKIWVTPHFSDTWAHPGQQQTPSDWSSLSFEELKNQVYTYTSQIMSEINPDYIQIGNEINTGILFPHGRIADNQDQFVELVNEGVNAVRNSSTNAKIILHCAGFESSNWFFNIVNQVDYDVIGISYYPWWHGKSLDDLQNQLSSLSINFEKEILIAETSYPFTLGWNDWTNNNVGLEEHLIDMFKHDFEFVDGHQSHLGHLGGKGNLNTNQEVKTKISIDSTTSNSDPIWTHEGERELSKIPFFVRGKVRRNTENYARQAGCKEINEETLYDAKAHYKA